MAQKSKTILYFAPHQDDELLSMGIDICTSLQNRLDVHVILCSDGSKSSVRSTLNNGKPCAKHAGEHIYDLSVDEFIQARDREFLGSCKALGVLDDNVHIAPNRGIDGSLSTDLCEKIVREYLKQLGGDAIVCTIAPNNGRKQHRDHKALGKAVDNLLSKGVIKEARFFVEPYHVAQITENPALVPVAPTITAAPAKTVEHIKAAIASYSYWNPDEQRYAVGYHSVTNEFNDFLRETKTYYYTKKHPDAMGFFEKKRWKRQTWEQLQRRTQVYYSVKTLEQPDLGDLQMTHIQGGQLDAYKEFCATHGVKLTEKYMKRITDGSSYWCLTNTGGEILSDGWLAYRHSFYISETDFEFNMDKSDNGILYNFNTREKHRGKGYYGILLKYIVHNAKIPGSYIIYTAPDNAASSRGITKAGFHYDGTLSASDQSLNNYLAKAGFTSISRRQTK